VYLEFVLQQVLLVGQLSVETEELSLIRGHFLCQRVRLECSAGAASAAETAVPVASSRKGGRVTYANVHFVLLVRIHGCWCGSAMGRNAESEGGRRYCCSLLCR
jgi:hypothetical protein